MRPATGDRQPIHHSHVLGSNRDLSVVRRPFLATGTVSTISREVLIKSTDRARTSRRHRRYLFYPTGFPPRGAVDGFAGTSV
jgi:hypothetical protein